MLRSPPEELFGDGLRCRSTRGCRTCGQRKSPAAASEFRSADGRHEDVVVLELLQMAIFATLVTTDGNGKLDIGRQRTKKVAPQNEGVEQRKIVSGTARAA